MSSPQKISQLTTAGPLTGAELVPIVQNGGTLQTTVSVLAAFAVVSISPVVSALGTQIAQVSAIASANTVAITSVQADVSALDIRVASVSAVTSVNSAAITSINNVVSALDARVSTLEIAVSNIGNVSAIAALVTAVASLEGTVSALTIRVAGVSASVSALQVQLNAVSALTSVNAAAITSINNTVSALEIRVSSASTTGVNNAASITSINAVISSLAISVSADVSAKVNRNNDFMTNVQYIDFNTTTSYAPSAGRLTWDLTHGTLDLGLTGTVNLLIGQRTVAQIYNNSGVTLPKGKAVKVTGASGQRLTGALAQADSDSDSATIFGLMLETVSNLGTGYVATDGVVTNVDTAAYSDGAIVYLSPVSAGELTPTKPIAPQHLVQMGYIVKGGSVGAGSIYVKVQNGYELGELHNVKTSAEASIANGEVLAWNTSASVWTNSTALLDTQASVSALNIQVAAVSASVSTLQIQINAVSAALTSTNNVVSALEIRVSAVSAAVVSANAVIAAVSALVSANTVAIAAVSASPSQCGVSGSLGGFCVGWPTSPESWRYHVRRTEHG
jgi:trimeric autotransporter adhesin